MKPTLKIPFKAKEQLADVMIEQEEKRKDYKLTEPLPAHIAEELKTRGMNRKEKVLYAKYVLVGFLGWLFFVCLIGGIAIGLFKLFTYVWHIVKPLIVQVYEINF